MPICLFCNNHIDHLIYRYEADIAEDFFLSGPDPTHGDIEISQSKLYQLNSDTYSCPQCDHLITTDLDDAIEFLLQTHVNSSRLPNTYTYSQEEP